MTQLQLAEAASLTTLSVSNIERAASWPKAETLDQLAEALHVRPYELFLDTERDEVVSKESLTKEIELLVRELQAHAQNFNKRHTEGAEFSIKRTHRVKQ